MRRTSAQTGGRRARGRTSGILMGVMILLLVVYLGHVVLGDSTEFDPLFDGWLYLLVEFAAVAVCVDAVVRTRFKVPQVTLAMAAVLVYTLGDAYYTMTLDGEEKLVEASLADVAYFLFYPFLLAALTVAVVRKLRTLVWPLVLDSIVGALGAASLMALALSPVLNTATANGTTFEMIVAIVYPLLDLLLITAVGGVLSLRGLDIGRRWPLLIVGIIMFSAADLAYALGLDDYVVGSVIDIGWVAGLVGIAAWVDGAVHPRRTARGRSYEIPEIAAPVVSTTCALAVLVVGNQLHIPLLAVIFAAATLALAAVPLTFRHRMLVNLARTDELTGLPNRRALLTDVPYRLDRGHTGALFLLDLDRFKHVNDALGHDVGDALLVQVSRRFSRQLRPGDLLARLGGDEFAVFLDGMTEQDAIGAAQRLKAELAEPVRLQTTTLQVSASIGIALTPDHGTDMNVLMRKADIAMFRAKSARSGHHVYDASDDDDGALRLRTIQELRSALAANEFELHYQPKLRLADQQVMGVEALIRWNHPHRGQLPPKAFLPLVEEAGLMPELSSLVLERVVRRVARWRAEGLDVAVAVNMSSSCIVPLLPNEILTLLECHGVPASCLVLEITEDMLLSDPAGTVHILGRLREEGVQVSIDDFGTGYSSLAYLRDLPVDELKLDRSFITAMQHDKRALGLVRSIIDLAHSLDLRVVAEGVEDEATLQELRDQGCDYGQGFLLSPPLPAPEVAAWIAARADSRAPIRSRASPLPG